MRITFYFLTSVALFEPMTICVTLVLETMLLSKVVPIFLNPFVLDCLLSTLKEILPAFVLLNEGKLDVV